MIHVTVHRGPILLFVQLLDLCFFDRYIWMVGRNKNGSPVFEVLLQIAPRNLLQFITSCPTCATDSCSGSLWDNLFAIALTRKEK